MNTDRLIHALGYLACGLGVLSIPGYLIAVQLSSRGDVGYIVGGVACLAAVVALVLALVLAFVVDLPKWLKRRQCDGPDRDE
jgi:hypothetical protein